MPFVATLYGARTAVGMRLGMAAPLQAVVPAEVRVTVAILGLFGVHAAAAWNQLVVWNSSGAAQTLFISWNCVGWQSLILLGLSLIVGLRGPMTLATRIQVIALGFFFSSRRRHTRFDCDWSSDVCSSDLPLATCLNRRDLGASPGMTLLRSTSLSRSRM